MDSIGSRAHAKSEVQVVNNWKRRSVPARLWPEIARLLGLSVEELLGGSPAPPAAAVDLGKLNPEEEVWVQAYRGMSEAQRNIVRALLHEFVSGIAPDLQQYLGKNNPGHSKRAEPALVTAQIIAQSETLAAHGKPRPVRARAGGRSGR